ncbi:ubiA prenyltransferase family protein [Lysobacter gummosus]|nr:ubiA prenyltransferase family protein [Lysobacter gummosus]
MTEHTPQTERSTVALCVDLDGTLLKSDLLYESVLALFSRRPLLLLLLPFWLLRGKAALKHEIASRVELDVATLPYDERVVDALRETQARPRVLCTASHTKFAQQVATHLGVFDLVLASDDGVNLSGANKAQALAERFGERGFDYMGNAAIDLPVWARARNAWVVNGSPGLAARAAQVVDVAGQLPAQGGGFKTWIKALRIHQWLKNLLVFLPLLASHRFFDVEAVIVSVLAFIAFNLSASGVYVLNDLLDLPADRQHPRKRLRPFAAGRLPLLHGLFVAPLLALAGFALALIANPWFALVLMGYYATTLAYSLRLKRIVMVDVIVLASLYTLRIIGGAVAIGATLSFWLLAFSMFIFLSLAMLKRYTELSAILGNGQRKVSGRGYAVEDLPLIQSLGSSAGYLAVLVFALYINSPESLALYARPQVLWLICPLLLYWISHLWMTSHRGGMDDDPVVFAATDRASQIVIVFCGLLALGAIG